MEHRDHVGRYRQLNAAKQQPSSRARLAVVQRGQRAIGALVLHLVISLSPDVAREQRLAMENIRQLLWVLSNDEEQYRMPEVDYDE